uniref:UPF0057-domain-containing protein n=1 Tax=Heterorhabditis bacteriophora TaxID=37862 RepID=A0A1I7XC96_HETBA
MCSFLLCVLALICPPLAVLFHSGCDCNLCINILLTCLGIIPGIIHAFYIICVYEDPRRQPTTVYIQTHQMQAPLHPPAYAS